MKEKSLWIFLTVAIVLGLLWQFFPLSNAVDRLNQVPLSGPLFSGSLVPLTETEEEIFKGVYLIKRVYTIGNQQAFIYMMDGTNNRHAIHDPTYCFRGGGWDILSHTPFPLNHGEGALYKIQKGNETREALLWFSDGKSQYASTWRYWWETTLRRITLGLSGKEPVLIVIQPMDDKPLNFEELIKEMPQLMNI